MLVAKAHLRNWTQTAQASSDPEDRFPAAGILFGLGLGGFFDGIVLHQLLQWQEFNTLWDGIFHSATYLFLVAGLVVLWRTAKRRHLFWSTKLLAGSIFVGFGAFNIIEGIINYHILGFHHVNERVDRSYCIYLEIAFLVCIAMFLAGWILLKQWKSESNACRSHSARQQLKAL